MHENGRDPDLVHNPDQDGVRRIALNRVQERCVVLADIVIPCAIPERVGQPIVMGDGNRGKPTQLPAADQR